MKISHSSNSGKTVPPLDNDDLHELKDIAPNCALLCHVNCEHLKDTYIDSTVEAESQELFSDNTTEPHEPFLGDLS